MRVIAEHIQKKEPIRWEIFVRRVEGLRVVMNGTPSSHPMVGSLANPTTISAGSPLR